MWCYGLIAGIFSVALAKAPITLTQANFEHDTQIGLGMTTGDWFIKFYAPWCGHCKRLAPVWEELADKLDGQVNVAEVDCTKEKDLAERFEIHGYPTILFFKDNKIHKFLGGRDVETLTEFATSTYKDAKVIKNVPAPPGMGARLSKVFNNIGQRCSSPGSCLGWLSGSS